MVFLRDIETHEPETAADSDGDAAAGTVTVRVKTNRPLSSTETEIVRARLLDV